MFVLIVTTPSVIWLRCNNQKSCIVTLYRTLVTYLTQNLYANHQEFQGKFLNLQPNKVADLVSYVKSLDMVTICVLDRSCTLRYLFALLFLMISTEVLLIRDKYAIQPNHM